MWKEGKSTNSTVYYLLNKEEELVADINEMQINFIYKNENGEWLAFELDKKLIENFKNIYLHPKSLKQILNEDRRKKLRIDKNNNSYSSLFQPKKRFLENQLKLEKIYNFEIKPTKIRSITDKALELLDKIKSEIMQKIKLNIDSIYEQFKSQLLIIKEESISLHEEDNQIIQSCNNFSSPHNQVQHIDNYVESHLNSVSNFISSKFPSDMCLNNEYTILPKNYEYFQKQFNDPENQIEQNINSLFVISPPETFIQLDSDQIFVVNSNQKRQRESGPDEKEIRPFFQSNQSEIPKIVKKDVCVIQKEQEKIDEIFGINKISLIPKKLFYNKCIECGFTSKKNKTWSPCCDNYLCESCYSKNIYFLAELTENENYNKFIDDCYFCSNNLFYCCFCLLIDLKENLIRCSSLLCNTYFHSNCFKCLQLLGNYNSEFSSDLKTEFYRIFSSKFLKIYYNRKSLDEECQKKLKNLNRQSLENFKIKNFLYNFYKNNTIEYIKFFLLFFTKEIVENKNLMNLEYNPDLANGVYCTKHICFRCFDFIDYSHDQEIKNKSECGITRHIESDCEKYTNQSVIMECKNSKSHFPLIHLNFFREIYNLTKSACHKIIIVYDKKKINYDSILKKFKFRSRQILADHANGGPIEDYRYDSMILNVKQNQEDINQSLDSFYIYKNLNKEENLELQKELKEFLIYSNISNNYKEIPVWLIKPKYQIENLRCPCMELAVKRFEELERKNLNFIITNFTKYINNKNFKKFLEVNKIKICNFKCTNKVNNIECNKFNCYASDSICSNRYKIKKASLDDLKIVKTLNKPNYGLVSLKNYSVGEFLMEVNGEVLTEIEWTKIRDRQKNWYTYKFSSNGKSEMFLYFYKKGNYSKFINHSCTPNATLQIWNSETAVKNPFKKGRYSKETINQRFLIFALKNIYPEEEITLDYRQQQKISIHNQSQLEDENSFKCKCSVNCENVIGRTDPKVRFEELKKLDEPFVSKMLFKDKFLDPFYFFINKFTDYEYFMVTFRKNILLKNLLKVKRKLVKKYYIKKHDFFKYFIQQNIVSFFGKLNCNICERQVFEAFICYKCFKTFHPTCFNDEKLSSRKVCSLCENSNKDKESENSILPINESPSSKFFSENIELIIYIDNPVESKLYTLKVYKIVKEDKKKICKFYSIFYEYCKEFNENYESLKLTKKFLFKSSQIIKESDQSIRKYLEESRLIFPEFVKMINNY
jgi:hypothetical protein